MQFSERYGYKKVDKSLVWEEVPAPLRHRVWNALINLFGFFERSTSNFLIKIFDKFLKEDIPLFTMMPLYTLFPQDKLLKILKQKFYNFEWYRVYDFIEFIIKEFPNKNKIKKTEKRINKVLKEENSAYRIVDGLITPMTDKEEIKEIEKALNPPDKFTPVRKHLKKALELFSDRTNPDYQNSIKECISALDSLASVIKGKKTAYTKFVDSLQLHGALKKGFSYLYGWTSDDKGIRHGTTGEKLEPLPAEARYMLVTISAFINYVIAKYGEEKIEENGNWNE